MELDQMSVHALLEQLEALKCAVRWAPSSAHWSEKLKQIAGPDARLGIDALECQIRGLQQSLHSCELQLKQCNDDRLQLQRAVDRQVAEEKAVAAKIGLVREGAIALRNEHDVALARIAQQDAELEFAKKLIDDEQAIAVRLQHELDRVRSVSDGRLRQMDAECHAKLKWQSNCALASELISGALKLIRTTSLPLMLQNYGDKHRMEHEVKTLLQRMEDFIHPERLEQALKDLDALASPAAESVRSGWVPVIVYGPRKEIFLGGNNGRTGDEPDLVVITHADYLQVCELLKAQPAPVAQSEKEDAK